MMNYFHHSRQIALFLEFARIGIDQGKQFICVYQVEITRQGQVSGRDRVAFYKWVTKFNIVPALRTIAKVSQEHLTEEGNMSFHEAGMFGDIGLVFLQLLYFSQDFRKN